MLKATELLNKFFEILVVPELPKPDRIKSEWTYLLSLLKGENIELERIEAYLNIIEKTEAKKRSDDSGRETPGTTIGLYKPQRNNSTIEKEKEFGTFSQSVAKDLPTALTSHTPSKSSHAEDSIVAMQLLSCITPLNKLLQSNNRLLQEEQHPRGKCDELTPKMIRNNFKKQPTYDSGSKPMVETKRYSSSFKNRY